MDTMSIEATEQPKLAAIMFTGMMDYRTFSPRHEALSTDGVAHSRGGLLPSVGVALDSAVL